MTHRVYKDYLEFSIDKYRVFRQKKKDHQHLEHESA
jgi:hypothetical protein